MSEAHSWKSYGFVVLVLILQIVIYFVVYSNVPIARMVVCFLYLMFVPGIAILKLLELKNLDTAEKALFSTGLSIAFLMFLGLIINEIGILAFANPLSLNLLLISINTVILLISLIATRLGGPSLPRLPHLKRREWFVSILLIISLFVLGSYGTAMVNTTGNSLLVLSLIIAISIAVSLIFLSERIFPPKLYPLVLFVIFICVVFFSGGQITKYFAGSGDGPIEFYAFRLTEINGFWNSAATSSPDTPILFPTYSMLSVTILPTVFMVITGMDGSWIFQLLHPSIVALALALGSYKLYQTQTENKAAFLATFFLITISIGKGMGSSKQQVAQLFYILLFLLLLKKDISSSKRSVLFTILGLGLVLSHYALGYIFLLTILLTFLSLALMNYRKTNRFSIYQTTIPLALVLILFTIAFSWYMFVNSSATLNLLFDEVKTVTSNLGQFFNPESRGTALEGLGVTQSPTVFHSISGAWFYLTEFLLVVGFVVLVTGRSKTSKFSVEYKIIAVLNMIIIAMNILLPRIADTFLMSRFYQTTLIILAPLAVLGGRTIIELVPKPSFRKLYAPILVFTIFIPFFLFQTGFIYEVVKVKSWSGLGMHRWNEIDLYGYIVNDKEVAGAQWLPAHFDMTNAFIYSDAVARDSILTSYGMTGRGRIRYLSNTTKPNADEFVYLASVDLISEGYIFNASEISPILEDQNKLYSNGGCEIYGGFYP